MRSLTISLGLVALIAAACNGGAPFDTGLQGQVMRGPIAPVCPPELTCDAPFAADFTVWRISILVAHFQSDSAGAFYVRLPPGTYTVVPSTAAPIVPGQVKTVIVKSESLTSVVLDFDTGIR